MNPLFLAAALGAFAFLQRKKTSAPTGREPVNAPSSVRPMASRRAAQRPSTAPAAAAEPSSTEELEDDDPTPTQIVQRPPKVTALDPRIRAAARKAAQLEAQRASAPSVRPKAARAHPVEPVAPTMPVAPVGPDEPDGPSIVATMPASRPVSRSPQPPDGFSAERARSGAQDVAKHLKNKGRSGYSRDIVRAWQKLAGIDQDGVYGRGTATALKLFSRLAPAPFFKTGDATYPWKDLV